MRGAWRYFLAAITLWNILALTIVEPIGFLRFTVFAPAAIVGNDVISYASVGRVARALRATNNDLGKRQAIKDALSALINRAYTLRISGTACLRNPIDLPLDATFIEKTGWSEQEYRNFFGGLASCQQAAEEAVAINGRGRQEAEAVLLPLKEQIEEEMPFSGAAQVFSDDDSSAIGGNLGAFTEATAPDWMKSVFTLPVGDITGVIDGPDGYWLLKRQDGLVLGIRHRKPTLEEVLISERENHPPLVFVW